MPIKKEEETFEQIVEIRRNNDYTTCNLLDYEKHYKLDYWIGLLDYQGITN